MPSPIRSWGPRLAFASYLLTSVSPTALFADSLVGMDHAAFQAPTHPIAQLADSADSENGESGGAESGEGESGEGESGEGEGGGSGPFAGAEPDTVLLGQLTMAHAHLLAGYRLASSKLMEEAMPHFHHPLAENYPAIEDALAERKLEPFEDELEVLSEAGESSEPAEILPAVQAAIAKIGGDEMRVLAAAPDRTDLALDTALRVLKQAADEYNESITDGAIAEAIEYQDAMAFIAQARELVEAEADTLVARNGDKYAAVLKEFDALRKAFPSDMPPAKPVLSTAEVFGSVSRIEIAMLPLKS